MRVLFIVRATLYTVRGGDTIQVIETARELNRLGIKVDTRCTNEEIDYQYYDLLHFFNITRPADILVHIKRSGKPFVLTPILINYAVYDQQQRPGVSGKIFRLLSADGIEYVKTVCRTLVRKDRLVSISYLWKGQKRSIQQVLTQAETVLVNAAEEYRQLVEQYNITPRYAVVPNGLNTDLFRPAVSIPRDECLVLCAARIEGIKNQLQLIRALNNTRYRLLIIGDAAPNQQRYYAQCKKAAAGNITFIRHLPQEELLKYYAAAKVHVLPSWFEVCGLSSLEAAAMGCNIVVTANGYARSYFGEAAWYCDPGDAASIFESVEKAACSRCDSGLQKNITGGYSWYHAAEKILPIYKKIISR